MFSRRRIVTVTKIFLLLLAVVAAAGFVSMYRGGGKLLSVQSGSMAPAIRKGELVSVKNVPLKDIAVGDVITFVSQDKKSTVTHRVVSLLPEDPAGNNIVTKGDANPRKDAPIEATSVVGKVNHSVPYLGYGLDLLRTWPGLVLLIYIPAFVIVIDETRRLAAYYRSLHYVLPGFLSARQAAGSNSRNLATAVMAGLAVLSFALPARAAMQNTVALTGNTISSIAIPPPEPEPEPSGVEGGISLRRVFIACEEGERVTSSVQIVLYNSSRKSVDISGWTIKSGNDILLKLPADTIIAGPGLYETEAPIIDGISYSNWNLKLYDAENEQIDEHTWQINTTRECRILL